MKLLIATMVSLLTSYRFFFGIILLIPGYVLLNRLHSIIPNRRYDELTSGYPYWLIRDGLPYDYFQLEKNITADVAIIGGGISGALAAWYLAKEGVSCVVIDARTIGLGSTCASTSLLQYEIDIPLCKLVNKIGLTNAVHAYNTCADSIDKLGLIAKKIGFSKFEKCSSLYFASNQKDQLLIKEEFDARQQIGLDVKLMSTDEIKKYAGFSAPAAILSGKAAVTDAYLFTHSLHQHSIKRGAMIFDKTIAEKIRHTKGGVTIITDKGFEIKSKKVVYANGYEAVGYIKEKIVKLLF